MWLPGAYNARLPKISSLLVLTILVGVFLLVAFFVFRYQDFHEENYSQVVGTAVRETQFQLLKKMNVNELANVMESLGHGVIQKMRLKPVEPVQSSQHTANLLLGIGHQLVSSVFTIFWLFGFVLSTLLFVFAFHFQPCLIWNDIDSLHTDQRQIPDSPPGNSYNRNRSQQWSRGIPLFHIFLFILIGSILVFSVIGSDKQIHEVFAFWRYVNGNEFIPARDVATIWLLLGLGILNSVILTISTTCAAENVYSFY